VASSSPNSRSGPRSSSQSAAPPGRVRPSVPAHYSRSPPCCSHCVSYLRPGSQPASSSHSGAKRRRSIAAAQPPSNAVSRPARYRVLRADLHERVCVSPGTDLSSALADADRLVRGSAALGLGVGASPFRAIGAVGFTGVFVVVAVVSLYRLSEWLWYADGVHITTRSSDRTIDLRGSTGSHEFFHSQSSVSS